MENDIKALENATETVYMGLGGLIIPEDARFHSAQDIEEMAQNMKINGQLQEIVVIPVLDAAGNTQYEVRAGVGRVQAALKLGWEKIRCFIRVVASEYEKKMITFVENEVRKEASPLYQAQLLDAMLKAKNCSQRDLAQEVGKDEATVSQYLSLLKFSPEVQKNFAAAKFSIKQLLALKKLPTDEAQLAAAQACQGLTNEESKKVVREHLPAQGKVKAKKPAADVAWKGDAILIHRAFHPKNETKSDYLTWLEQALDALLTTPLELAPNAPVIQAIMEPTKQVIPVV